MSVNSINNNIIEISLNFKASTFVPLYTSKESHIWLVKLWIIRLGDENSRIKLKKKEKERVETERERERVLGICHKEERPWKKDVEETNVGVC